MHFIKKYRFPIGLIVILLVAGATAFVYFSQPNQSDKSEKSSVTVEKISGKKTSDKSSSSASQSSENSTSSSSNLGSDYGFQRLSDTQNKKIPIDLSQYTTSKVEQFRAYCGHEEANIPMTEGTIKPNKMFTDGIAYWHSSLTVDGKKIPVVASYQRMGSFAIYTTQPTDKDLSFIYNGQDYNDYIGKDNLDAIAHQNN
ncbi:hypothetical protein [Fructobacillus durionis]|uniref:DUF4767 domain-containing protein n=1 Tax=Fructobacillus durionis TaxID=283737 RepID=A0A1I1GR05_9LACO|nr:hypothetical protein [Fructobacillus durionis]SFC13926.1 hypothetical protein SAMN05660453_1152 [Fructobacillus durionis]